MSVRHSSGTAHALYRTFVLPCSSPTSATAAKRATANPPRYNRLPNRTLSSTAALSAREPRGPEVRQEKRNEQISSQLVYLIDNETNTISPEPRTRFDLLRRLNQTTHRLIQFDTEHEGLPVCKIVSKKDEYEKAKRLKEASKERKKTLGAVQSLKTLELNWAMDPNDLGHRLDKIVEFLTEGKRVEIILASKKRGRKATPEECEEVLRKIRKAVDGVNGAKEAKEMEGKIGGFATLFFIGRTGQQQISQAAG